MNLLTLKAILGLDTTQYDNGLNGAESKAKSFGGKLAGGMAKAAKAGAVAVAAVGTAATAAGAAMVHATGKVAEYGDNIDKMSQKMGLSAEKYQEWDAIMQHSGTSIEAMKPSMKTLAMAAESGSDAFQKLGMSQQEVANMSQEELFEKTIAALQNVQDDTERTYLAGKLLGRGATELGALLNTSAEDTEKMRQRVHELGGVLSDEAVKASAAYQDSLQDMQTAMDGIKRKAIAEFLPGMTQVMDGITSIVAGEKGGQKKIQEGVDSLIEKFGQVVPKFAKAVTRIGGAVFRAIGDNLPSITENIVNFFYKAIQGTINAVPKLAEAAITILREIVSTIIKQAPKLMDGLAEFFRNGLPTLVEELMNMVDGLVDELSTNSDGLVDAGINMIMALADGVSQSIPILVERVPEIIIKFNMALIEHLPQIIVAGGRIPIAIAQGIMNGLRHLPSAAMAAIKTVADRFGAHDWTSLGRDVMRGLAQGIYNWMTLPIRAIDKVASFVVDKAKSVLQINSPSKVFREKIGAGIAEGMAYGITDGIPVVLKAMDELSGRIVAPALSEDYISYADDDGFTEENAYDVLNTPVIESSDVGRDVTVVLQLDRTQLARTVFRLNNEETQRVGVSLVGGNA